MDYSFPGIEAAVSTDPEIGRLFESLEEAMGKGDEARLYTWLVVLVLATYMGT